MPTTPVVTKKKRPKTVRRNDKRPSEVGLPQPLQQPIQPSNQQHCQEESATLYYPLLAVNDFLKQHDGGKISGYPDFSVQGDTQQQREDENKLSGTNSPPPWASQLQQLSILQSQDVLFREQLAQHQTLRDVYALVMYLLRQEEEGLQKETKHSIGQPSSPPTGLSLSRDTRAKMASLLYRDKNELFAHIATIERALENRVKFGVLQLEVFLLQVFEHQRRKEELDRAANGGYCRRTTRSSLSQVHTTGQQVVDALLETTGMLLQWNTKMTRDLADRTMDHLITFQQQMRAITGIELVIC